MRLDAFLRERSAQAGGGGRRRGYIGLEMAGALRTRGLEVTLIESGADLLHCGDAHLTQVIVERLKLCQVEVRLGGERGRPYAVAARPDPVVRGPEAERRNSPPRSGVEIGRTGAIHTDDRMETSLRGVFAAGDCCETSHVVSGKPCWLPLGNHRTEDRPHRRVECRGRGASVSTVSRARRSVKVCGLGVGRHRAVRERSPAVRVSARFPRAWKRSRRRVISSAAKCK